MKLHEKYIQALFIGAISYASTYLYVFVINKSTNETMTAIRWIVAALPFYCLVALGSYLLFRLGRDIFAFNDYPEERMKLEKVNTFASVALKNRRQESEESSRTCASAVLALLCRGCALSPRCFPLSRAHARLLPRY